jgi:hypothetical protein
MTVNPIKAGRTRVIVNSPAHVAFALEAYNLFFLHDSMNHVRLQKRCRYTRLGIAASMPNKKQIYKQCCDCGGVPPGDNRHIGRAATAD